MPSYAETAIYVDSVAYTAVAMWTASTAYTVGQIVRQRTTPAVNNERCFVCVVAGTSAASEPTWIITRGGATTETGGLKWQETTGVPTFNEGNSSNTCVWRPSISGVFNGEIIKNTAQTHYFIGNGGGGGATEPSWNTTLGATTL